MKKIQLFERAYKDWLVDIKARVRTAQIKAALKVNTELLDLYWTLGEDIVEKQKNLNGVKDFYFVLVKI